jgi:HEAT repeat protein
MGRFDLFKPKRLTVDDVNWLASKMDIEGLIKALRYKDPSVRHAAAYSLGAIGAISRSLEPLIQAALNDEDENVRAQAVEILGEFSNVAKERAKEAIIQTLNDALNDKSVHVRRKAEFALDR